MKLADDNKPLKYARYAIGEIVFAVIGILLLTEKNQPVLFLVFFKI
jgi:hypothetical protein